MVTRTASTLILSLAFVLTACPGPGGSSSTTNPDEAANVSGDGEESNGGGASGGGGTYAELGVTLPNLEDDDITITSATEKDIHILCFWAVWCVPCKDELNAMMPMWEELRGRGLNVYAISTDGPDSAARVPGEVRQHGWEFPVLLDRESEVLSKYHPKGDIPFYVILDADGEILKTHQGYVKGDMEALRTYLEEILPAGE